MVKGLITEWKLAIQILRRAQKFVVNDDNLYHYRCMFSEDFYITCDKDTRRIKVCYLSVNGLNLGYHKLGNVLKISTIVTCKKALKCYIANKTLSEKDYKQYLLVQASGVLSNHADVRGNGSGKETSTEL